ncbi:MAG: hypothetical protein AB1505_07790 [Candidatus Latescibacterota bacterium]
MVRTWTASDGRWPHRARAVLLGMLLATGALGSRPLHGDEGSSLVRVRLRQPMRTDGFTFPSGQWLTGSLVRLDADTLVLDAFRRRGPVAIPVSALRQCQVKAPGQQERAPAPVVLRDVGPGSQALLDVRPRPGPLVEVGVFGGGAGVSGRRGSELWDHDVRYRFASERVWFGPGAGFASTALFGGRSVFISHDFQLHWVPHRMRVYDWQGPDRLSFIHPGVQTRSGSLQQSSTTLGISRPLGRGLVRLGAGVSGLVGTHRSGWAMWGSHLLLQYGVRPERGVPWTVELRARQGRGTQAGYAEFDPAGHQVTVGTLVARPQRSAGHAVVWSGVTGALCWLWFWSWVAVGE